MKLPNDPATLLLHVYPKGLKSGSRRGAAQGVYSFS